MNNVIALIGNPNSGKTTLFNTITGTYQKTGNWTGVTTEKKEGAYKKDKRIKVVDLPGLYSLSAHGEDEMAVIKYLKKTPPKAIINIVDGTNLERNLYLTTELVELNVPIVIAVNMVDDLEKNGIKLRTEKLSALFGVPVVPVSALKNINIDKLIDIASKTNTLPKTIDLKKANKSKAEKRYEFIEKNIDEIIVKKQTRSEKFTLKADSILTHKIWGFPIFFLVITLVYFLSIKIGGIFSCAISNAFRNLSKATSENLCARGVPEWLVGLVSNAIIKGMGMVSSFLPQILVLFLLLAVIEESGYASRIAFILDKFFRSFGLSGKSLIPMIVSCGCTVTGIMATRTIENKSEKRMTVFLAPFMPCGAKTAVFGWMAYNFFEGNALIASSMYFLGILSVAVFGKILKKFNVFKDSGGVFILEMPTLRMPSLKDIALTLWEKIKDFVVKAGGIVFLVTVGLWTLQNVGFRGYTYGNAERSFLYLIGNSLKFIFYPLGFGNWQATVATLSSLLAKEAVVESLEMVSLDPKSLFHSAYSVYAFMAFVLLSPPCSASIATAKRELNSGKWLFFMIMFQFLSAYIVAFSINGMGFLISLSNGLILTVITVIIILIGVVLTVVKLKNIKCAGCTACDKGKKCTKHSTI
jgi:ferrous iron transport protein B